jgi:hypothetical protein
MVTMERLGSGDGRTLAGRDNGAVGEANVRAWVSSSDCSTTSFALHIISLPALALHRQYIASRRERVRWEWVALMDMRPWFLFRFLFCFLNMLTNKYKTLQSFL